MEHIRNFSIIAHIDHGKSTLADRMLEITQTVDERTMQDQMLDSMELERERGITIKMQPVRMRFVDQGGQEYTLNLIDTPGHIDFSYEVSRALKAVEGSLLLVDATQGVQAQTFTTLDMAREQNLAIIPVLTKVDSPLAQIDDVSLEVAELLGCDLDDILLVSGKTGEGVPELLETIIERIPPPQSSETQTIEGKSFRGLIFDFEYSSHKGIILYVRIIDGSVTKGDELFFHKANKRFLANEVGIFSPTATPQDNLTTGNIGYIVTGIKEAGIATVGDTVTLFRNKLDPLPGYQTATPVVWASLYPESQDDFDMLRTALDRLRLSDSSLQYEEEVSGTLGRGFRCGFLGMLHLEIITERLLREHNLELIITSPSVIYHVTRKNGEKLTVYSPPLFPDHGDVIHVSEPWVLLKIMVPSQYVSPLMQLLFEHEGDVTDTLTFGDGRTQLTIEMPLRELMRNFFDELKSATSGYASLSYEMIGERDADVERLDIMVADEPVPAFARVVARRRVQEEAEDAVERLFAVLPRQMFQIKIQGKAHGRILASRTVKAFRKDVTGHLYGGDITRKMKLREKQKKGKKKMAGRGNVNIPHDVFLKMMKK
jgi:GTP-binding protein LepA